MSKFANFSKSELVFRLGVGQHEVGVFSQPPFNLPADPGGEIARVTIVDDLRRPTDMEVITYTGTQEYDDFTALTGVQRGQDGTDELEWPAGAAVVQDLPAALLNTLAPRSDGEIVGMAGPYLHPKAVDRVDVLWQDVALGPILLKTGPEPPNPKAGASLYMISGQVFAKWPNGSTTLLASA